MIKEKEKIPPCRPAKQILCKKYKNRIEKLLKKVN